MTMETVTTAGNRRRVQVRKARKDGFGAEKKQIFLDTLAMCCTVTAAAKAAGVSTVTVNYHRRRDPVFAQQEAEALAAGYVYLEAASLARAARGGRYEPAEGAGAGAGEGAGDGGAGDGAAVGTPGAEALDADLALHLLQLRHKGLGQRTGQAGYAPKRVSEKDLTESILAKLEILDQRLKGGGGRALKRHEVRKVKSRDRAARTPEGRTPSPQPSPPGGEGAGPRIR